MTLILPQIGGLTFAPRDISWDLSRASYDGVNLPVGAVDAIPTGIFFKPDGSVMYLSGRLGEDVTAYGMTVPWDLSTATLNGDVSTYPSTVFTNQQDLFFKPDGTKMFIANDSTGDGIVPFTLSTPWVVSTATYDGARFSTSAQGELSPTAVTFKPDGTKMFVTGFDTETIYQYSVPTAWDVNTATYDGVSLNVQPDTSINPDSISFRGDGLTLYATVGSTRDLHSWNLTAPWDLSTATFANADFNMTQETRFNGHFWKPDGLRFYSLSDNSDTVFQYSIT